MFVFWVTIGPLAALLLACAPGTGELSLRRAVSGAIRAGERRCYSIELARDQTAHLLLLQRDINLAIEAQGISTDSSDWGEESAYVTTDRRGRVPVCISVEAGGSREGLFSLRVHAVRGRRKNDELTVLASERESRGRRELDARTADKLGLALGNLEEAVRLWRQFGDARREANALVSYGIAQERMDHYGAADAAYTEATAIFERTGDRASRLHARKTWMNLGGRVGEIRGTVADLDAMLTEARSVGDRRGILLIASSLSNALQDREGDRVGELKKEALRIARALGDKGREAEMLGKLSGWEVHQGNLSSALFFARDALRLAEEAGDLSEVISVKGLMAAIYGMTGEPEREVPILRWLVAAHEKRGDFSAWANATSALSGLLAERRDFAEASGLLRDLHGKLDRYYGSDGPAGLYFTNPGGADLAGPAGRLGQHPGYARQTFWLIDSQRGRFFTRDTVDRTNELQEALPADTILIEYAHTPNRYSPGFLWIVDGKKIQASQTGLWAGEDLSGVAERLSNPDVSIEGTRAIRARLSQLLLSPLKGKMRGKRLVIVPDEGFASIPFALLPDPEYEDGSLLGEHHEVMYTPSGQFVAASMSQPKGAFAVDLLLGGDPVTNRLDSRLSGGAEGEALTGEWTATARAVGALQEGNELPRLAYAGSEVRRLRAATGKMRVTEVTGFEAHPAGIKENLPKARLVHIISHGFVDLQKPSGSGLAFSFWDRNGKAREGFLRFEEISRTRIASELVTLGACQTAVGRVITNNGIPSLAAAFLRAGARRVISSWWKVDDAATAELMVQFYRNLLSDKHPTPAAALWQAQMYVAAQPRWRNPSYWAGFTLTGDWRPL